ncbi:MAG: hypothetical protein SF162_16745 [bacterium]|nr:hypothetical protein [bacterium]
MAAMNYPDVLGYITNGERLAVGAAHIAVSTRPAEGARAGQATQVLVLAQNMLDVDIDLIAVVQVPDTDARRQKHKFSVKTGRYVVGMKAAEVGVLSIPVLSLLDTAPGDGYKVGIELDAKALHKGERVRGEGGGFNREYLSADALKKCDSLRKLTWSAHKRAARNALDVTFNLLPPRLNQPIDDVKAGWLSLVRMPDYLDPRLSMHRFGDVITSELLPRLRRETMYEPLVTETQSRFARAGFPLRESEARLIARLMALILEYAAPKETQHGFVIAGHHNIKALLLKDPRELDDRLRLPRWFQAMLSTISKDESAAANPAQVIPAQLYPDLLYDAIIYGFNLVETATGEDLGTAPEIEQYAQQNLERLAGGGLDFSRVYLPLVMAGILINDRLLMGKEEPVALLRGVGADIEDRVFDIAEDDTPIYEMTNQLIMQQGQRYGFYK